MDGLYLELDPRWRRGAPIHKLLKLEVEELILELPWGWWLEMKSLWWSPRWILEVLWWILEARVWVEEEGILGELLSLELEWRKKKNDWFANEKDYISWGFCEVRWKLDRCKGLPCKKGGEVSLEWPLGRPWEGERMSGVRWMGEWEMRWHDKVEIGICNYWKMPEIQVSLNDLKILPKIKNNI